MTKTTELRVGLKHRSHTNRRKTQNNDLPFLKADRTHQTPHASVFWPNQPPFNGHTNRIKLTSPTFKTRYHSNIYDLRLPTRPMDGGEGLWNGGRNDLGRVWILAPLYKPSHRCHLHHTCLGATQAWPNGAAHCRIAALPCIGLYMKILIQ